MPPRHNTKIHKQKQYNPDKDQDENPFLLPFLKLGIPAWLARMFLSSLDNDEDVFDIVDRQKKIPQFKKYKKTEGPNGPVPVDKPKPEPEPKPDDLPDDDDKPKPDPKLDDFPTVDDEPYPEPEPILIPVIFTTMQDSKVDDVICMPMHGDVWELNDTDRPVIPDDTHPYCRCFWVHALTGEKLGQQ